MRLRPQTARKQGLSVPRVGLQKRVLDRRTGLVDNLELNRLGDLLFDNGALSNSAFGANIDGALVLSDVSVGMSEASATLQALDADNAKPGVRARQADDFELKPAEHLAARDRFAAIDAFLELQAKFNAGLVVNLALPIGMRDHGS